MLKKVRKKSCKRPFIQIRNWVCSLSSVQVLRKSIQGFLCNPPDKPTINKQTYTGEIMPSLAEVVNADSNDPSEIRIWHKKVLQCQVYTDKTHSCYFYITSILSGVLPVFSVC